MKTMTRLIRAAFAVGILALGALIAKGAPGDLFASVNGNDQKGGGFIYRHTPDGVQSTFASGLSRPRGLAFDSVGNLFVAINSCEATCKPAILKIAPDGTQNIFATMPVSFIAEGLAIDGSDNVFVAAFKPFYLSLIYKFGPDGKGRAVRLLGDSETEGFGLAFDTAGNLLAADAVAQTIYRFAPHRTRSVFVGPEAFVDLGGPLGLAFDSFGNLFVSAVSAADELVAGILTVTPSGVTTTFALDLDNPRGLVFDNAGDLFVAEIPFFASGDILRFTPDGMRTVFASGIGDPAGNSGPEFLTIQPGGVP